MLAPTFLITLDVFAFQIRVIRLSKSLLRETYTTKKFSFQPSNEYESFKLTAELHLTKKKYLFILESLKLIKKLYDNISKTLFIPYRFLKLVKIPRQSSLFLHFYKRFSKFKILHDLVWNKVSKNLL